MCLCLHFIYRIYSKRSREQLERLTSFGPRTTGSPANEITAVNVLLDALHDIQVMANKNDDNSIR